MSATVLEPTAAVTTSPRSPVALRTPTLLRSTAMLPVMCELAAEPIRSCQLVATAVVDGSTVTVGRGHAALEGRPVAHKLAVGVELTELGRELVARPGGVTLVVDAAVQGAATSTYSSSEPLHVTARP